MKKGLFWALTLLLYAGFCQAQDTDDNSRVPVELGFEYQMYPAGMMPGLKLEAGLGKYHRHSLNLRVGYNRARRQDWGEHADERGGGWGGTLGYRFYVKQGMKGLFFGARNDIWRLNIDWRNPGANESELLWTDTDVTGSTRILIVQPTAEVGYKFLIPVGGRGHFFITPAIAAGWEYNAKTEGDPVGQGAIALWGLDVGIRF